MAKKKEKDGRKANEGKRAGSPKKGKKKRQGQCPMQFPVMTAEELFAVISELPDGMILEVYFDD